MYTLVILLKAGFNKNGRCNIKKYMVFVGADLRLAFLRIIEWLRSEGTSGNHLVQTPASAGPHRAGCPTPYPGNF